MKRIAFILTSLLVLSFGFAYGQSDISVDHVDGLASPTQVAAGQTVTFHIRYTQNGPAAVTGSTNGFKVYSPDGAVFSPITYAETGAITPDMYDGGTFLTPFSIDGIGADTIGYGGFKLFKPGLEPGFDEIVLTISTSVEPNTYDGLSLCIDSAFYPPGGAWVWSSAPDVNPTWTNGGCFEIYTIPNLPPTFGPDADPAFGTPVCEEIGNQGHCDVAMKQFTAVVALNDDEPGLPISYSLVSGIGAIDAGTGMWSYAPSQADVGTHVVVVQACDALNECTGPNASYDDCTSSVTFTNEAPSFTAGCDSYTPVGKGNPVSVDVDAVDGDCDGITFSIVDVVPTPTGVVSIDANTGVVTFATVEADAAAAPGTPYTITVAVSDGLATVECDLTIDVLFTEPYQVRIEKTHLTIQGGHESVDITVEAGSETMGGFDLLIAYDASALTFVTALEGDIYSDCGWEYFTYRFGATGNCSGGCPSGLLRIVGIAETNNGAYHPTCFFGESKPFTLASLDFLVTDDRTLECQYVPIRFLWMDCADNTIASESGDTLFISRFVYDYDRGGELTNVASYPTYTGAQDADCFVGDAAKVPVRFIDFFNGGIDIACADELDARGDVNLNEIGYEIADAVLFSNYFVYGLGVFWNIPGQVAATDVNADGLSLSVADLVYLTRVVIGDAQPYPKLNPEVASYSVDNGTVRVNSEMGAASIIVSGNTVPTLMADNMEMRYNFDGTNTRILVYSTEANAKFSGDFLNVNGDIIDIEMATYEGTPVAAKVIPANYSLKQNYPNPFNPSTTVAFDMANAGKYTLTVYNVTGQKVAEFADFSEAGTVTVDWDASMMASGIYFYKLNADNFTDTKKMVLLK